MNTEYRIVFVDAAHNAVSETVIAVPGHWEACKEGLRLMPDEASDFQVTEVGRTTGPEVTDAEALETARRVMRESPEKYGNQLKKFQVLLAKFAEQETEIRAKQAKLETRRAEIREWIGDDVGLAALWKVAQSGEFRKLRDS